MKLRVKATNETMPVAEDSYICGLQSDGDEVEFLVSDVELIPDGWNAYRREVAKDILAAIVSCPSGIFIGDKAITSIRDHVSTSIELADELIKQLKEKEK